ncbi:MAG: hypothetical protein SGI74_10780 [Oligoflexia bacterium]|nr:hypothetical protein [Oligoflexia bacterium]
MKVVALSTVLILGFALAGCGRDKQDPIKDFRHLPQQPANEKTQDKQKIDSINSFSFAPVDAPLGSSILPEIAEGETKVYKVRVVCNEPGAKDFTVRAVQLPSGAQLIQTKEKDPSYNPNSGFAAPQYWLVRWTPGHYTVIDGLPATEAIVLEAAITLPKIERYQRISKKHTFAVSVKKDTRDPEIVAFNNLPSTITEGQTVAFTVEVNDPSGYETAPIVDFSASAMANNKERFSANGTRFITQHPQSPFPRRVNKTLWRYDFVFDTSIEAVPTPLNSQKTKDLTAPGVDVCFRILAKNATNRISNPKEPCVTVMFTPSKPEFIWGNDASTTEVRGGTWPKIPFFVKVKERGNVSVESMTDLTTIEGQPVMSCSPINGKTTEMKCDLDWNIPCKVTIYQITFKAENKLGETKSAVTTLTHSFKVIPSNEKCEVPVPTKAAPKKKASPTPAPAATLVVGAAPIATASPTPKQKPVVPAAPAATVTPKPVPTKLPLVTIAPEGGK